MILRTLGWQHRIWEMPKSWFSSLSGFSLCLGSQRPGGGVVLGSDTTLVDFHMF